MDDYPFNFQLSGGYYVELFMEEKKKSSDSIKKTRIETTDE